MPSTIIHEKVGYYISKKINFSSPDYYLGILAPDAVNYEGFAPKIVRWTSHVRAKDYNEWRQNIKNLYLVSKDNINDEFLIGYIIHLLTDVIYDDSFYLDVRETIINDRVSLEDAHDVMRDDMNKYYFPEIEDIKKILKSSQKSYGFLNIDSSLLQNWKNKCIETFNKENKAKYLTEEIVIKLAERTYQELKNSFL